MNKIDHKRANYLWVDVIDDIGIKTGTAFRLLAEANFTELQRYVSSNKTEIRAELEDAFPRTRKVKYAIAPIAIYDGEVQPGDRFRVLEEFMDGESFQVESLLGYDDPTYIRRYNCAHLNGGDWIIVEREE